LIVQVAAMNTKCIFLKQSVSILKHKQKTVFNLLAVKIPGTVQISGSQTFGSENLHEV
jgi:hypothetical protein